MIIARSATYSQRSRSFSKCIGKALAITLAMTCAASAQTTIYVNDDNCPTPGAGSLVDPYCSIQDAIDASVDTDTIEVAPGTYHEAIDFIGKAITLRSSDGPATTIIDATTVPAVGETVSVVKCVNNETATTVLDGFTITGGTGDIATFGIPVGGGMYNFGSSPTVKNCMFIENIVPDGSGGGMLNNDASPNVTNCTFRHNSANQSGGGGMRNYQGSRPTIKNCMFIGNTAKFGGGMINGFLFDEQLSVSNCTFAGNSAIDNAGIYGMGGGIFAEGSSPLIINCTFSGNAARLGGGIYLYQSASPNITNCTFSNNLADSGDALYNAKSSNPKLTNCILWDLGSDEIVNDTTTSTSTPTITFSNVKGSGGSAAWYSLLGIDGGHNIDINPLFVDPLGPNNIAGTIDDNLRLMPNSPAINSGDNSSVPIEITTDLDGLPRIVCGSVDMGAYENQSPHLKIHNITQDRFYCRIQDCIDAAVNADVCVVSPGTYFETINFLGKAIILRSSHGPASTIIDAAGVSDDGNGVSVATCISGETATTVLDGFTITGGKTSTNYSTEKTGSGMLNDGSSPTVANCIFTGNVADYGGGMRNINSASPIVTSCTFSNNTALWGGGMFNDNFSSPTITNCFFYENDGGLLGGAMLNVTFSSPTITNCLYSGNTARSGGGFANFDSSNPVISNCVFNGNIASGGGGGAIGNYDSSPYIINCTLSNNTASIRGGGGGGIRNIDNSNPTLTNCILHGNSPDEIINDVSSTPTIAHSNIDGSGGSTAWDIMFGIDGGGNIDADPVFIDPLGPDGLAGTDDDDLRLLPGSPCIDAADYDAYFTSGGGLTDLDGKDRIIDDTSVVDTGIGIVTHLDMGAYETGLCHEDCILGFDEFSNLNECLTGPASSINLGCACVDLDFDEQIDLRDFAQFQLAFNP